jgi:DnaJ-class molecular chaperone
MSKLYISDGHNPKAQGACYNQWCEWSFVDSVTNKLKGWSDLVVVPDGTLKEKVDWVNDRIQPGDIYIDIHLDLSKGSMIFTHPQSNRIIANKIIKAYTDFIGIRNKGSYPDWMSQHKSLYVCQWTKNKSGYVLELGSIKDLEEFKIIQKFAYGGILQIYKVMCPNAQKDVLRKKLGEIRKAMNNEKDEKKKKTLKMRFNEVFQKLANLLRG